ncbi:MAG TPA: hypothetical protein VKV34_03310 [Thermoleophilia bacterium]|nr:hypothetical protein [Thermoleophilia bacterium]
MKEQPRTRPVPLLFDPADPEPETARFFGLDEITDAGELLHRATALVDAFRNAADRAGTYQAIAAAELTDPRRFDRITYPELADRVGCTPAAAETLAERGRQILKGAAQREF